MTYNRRYEEDRRLRYNRLVVWTIGDGGSRIGIRNWMNLSPWKLLADELADLSSSVTGDSRRRRFS